MPSNPQEKLRFYHPTEFSTGSQRPSRRVLIFRGLRLYFLGPAAFLVAWLVSDRVFLSAALGTAVMFANHAELEQRSGYLAGLEKSLGEYVRDFIRKARFSLLLISAGLLAGWWIFGHLRGLFQITETPASLFSLDPQSFAGLGLTLFCSAICGDFLVYWYHRSAHSFGETAFWRMHTVHHSIPYFTAAYGARAHGLETFLTYFWYGAGAGFIGTQFQETFALGTLVMLFMSAHHINAETDVGPLKWIFITTEAHRWHHHQDWKQSGNFSLLLTAWDLLFGTYFCPRPFDGQMGLEDFPHEFPEDLLSQTALILPQPYQSLKDKNNTLPLKHS
ncbi:MAG: sterol desaturase family protein [Polyangiaceae bacterium]|nr:sterol desaturase family protein [Polyangiaceae bacterium]